MPVHRMICLAEKHDRGMPAHQEVSEPRLESTKIKTHSEAACSRIPVLRQLSAPFPFTVRSTKAVYHPCLVEPSNPLDSCSDHLRPQQGAAKTYARNQPLCLLSLYELRPSPLYSLTSCKDSDLAQSRSLLISYHVFASMYQQAPRADVRDTRHLQLCDC